MFNGIILDRSTTPDSWNLRFQIPHGKKDGISVSITFDPMTLKQHNVSKSEDLPSFVWFEKMRNAFDSLISVIDEEGLDKNV